MGCLFRRGDRDLTFLVPADTEFEAFGCGLGWLTLRAREDPAVVSWRGWAEAGRDVDRELEETGFLSFTSGVSVVELLLLGVLASAVSKTFDLMTTVRTVVAVTAEPSLDEDESSGWTQLSRSPSLQFSHVLTVDAATMSANVSIAEADVGLSGSDCTTSNSCTVKTSSGTPSNCKHMAPRCGDSARRPP